MSTCSGRHTCAASTRSTAHLASAEAVDRWTALVIAAYTQLLLARNLVDDLRRPWQPRPKPGMVLSPYRVRLGFRRLRTQLPSHARPPRPRHPTPGRPKGSRNKPKATRPVYRSNPPTSTNHEARPIPQSQA